MKHNLVLFASDPSTWQLQSTIAWYVEGSAELYEAFLRDLVGLMGQLNQAEPVIRYAPDLSRPFFHDLAPQLSVLPQRGMSERERLNNALSDHLDATSHAVLLWAHTPHLPLSRLRDAFTRLEDGADLVLGPCEDGNLYLVGLRQPQPELLLDLPARPAQRLSFLRNRAAQLGLKVALLPAWYAVTSYSDLQRLATDLQTMPRSSSPATRNMLAGIGGQAREVGG
jgi:hypothetical protein